MFNLWARCQLRMSELLLGLQLTASSILLLCGWFFRAWNVRVPLSVDTVFECCEDGTTVLRDQQRLSFPVERDPQCLFGASHRRLDTDDGNNAVKLIILGIDIMVIDGILLFFSLGQMKKRGEGEPWGVTCW